jgi:hypothetical protein
LNQKIPRQPNQDTSAPPNTGPTARASPDTAAHTPIARSRARCSVYTCRSMDSVPGSLAAAPSPITARPAISTLTSGASAHSSAPPQNTPAPASMTRLRPSSSPIIPQASMMLAKASAYALTTHCSDETPAPSSVCTLPRATATIVLSRNVRNSSVHSAASATGLPPRRAVAATSVVVAKARFR